MVKKLVAELETEQFIFFWGGTFSNWAKNKFHIPLWKDGPGMDFNCVEQYMMAQKAHIFMDMDSLSKIMKAKEPFEQKALGRQVKNFSQPVWAKHARDVTYNGIYAKFSQPDMKEIILSTGNKCIVEASPFDKIWGIGLGIDDTKHIDNVLNWQGSNWLGQVTMRVRDDLLNGIDNSFTEMFWSTNPMVYA